MKIAILGRSPLALEAALRFHLHGAALTWYVGSDDLSLFSSGEWSPENFSSDLGRAVLKEMDREYHCEVFNWSHWITNYEAPLMKYLKLHQEIRTDEVISVTKRFLAPCEQIEGRSRFLDLFRVIYQINPKDFIEEQKETSPETYQRLTDEFIQSLTKTIEMYQDFDLVVDLRNDLSKSSAAVSGRALGEGRESDKVYYGLNSLVAAKTMDPTPELREIALIGSDSLAAETLLSLEHWLKDPRSRMFIVTTEENPFSAFLSVANSKTKERLNQLFDFINQEFEAEINGFTKKLHEWQELDDFVQVKIPKPVEPIPRLNFFSGHNVTAIDELIDKKRMFLTLERPEFRFGKKHPENNQLDLKTIGADRILVTHAKRDTLIIQIDREELGHFSIIPSRPTIEAGWRMDLDKLKGIEDEIFKLFSPVDSH